jgi:GGDEF domain-containing protein
MLISLRRYLDNRPEQVIDALLRLARLLLQGIELHAVKGDAADYDKFRADIHRVNEGLTENTPAQEILVLAGLTVRALEEYNSRAGKYVHSQCIELQNMVSMLTKTMADIASGSDKSIARLQDIEKQLHKASLFEDFHTAKLRMAECLDGLRNEIDWHRTNSAQHVSELRSVIEHSNASLRRAPIVATTVAALPAQGEPGTRTDPLTGLPERTAAEALLNATVKQGMTAFAVPFLVDRLDLINARFGRTVGDDVLLYFCQHVAQGLTGSDRLFRWSGPALLAVMNRTEQIGVVRDEVSRLLSKRLTRTVALEGRSVLLPVAATWKIFAAHEIRPLPRLIRSIDAFVHGEPKDDSALAAL